MIKKTLLLLLLALQCMLAAAQHRFQAGIGYQRTWMIDKQVSPLKYQSSENFPAGLRICQSEKSGTGKNQRQPRKVFPYGL